MPYTSSDTAHSLKIVGLNNLAISENKTNSLIIGISVGGPNHEGKRFSALIDTINKIHEKLNNCTIAVCDTLQRHNYMISGKVNEEQAFSKSRIAGDNWVERNKPILEKLKISYKIVRWDEWLKCTTYKSAVSKIKDLLCTSSDFQKDMQTSVETFSSRFTNRHKELGLEGNISNDLLKSCCRAYLIEECAIMMNVWPIYKADHCQHILYPGNMTKALSGAYENTVTQKNLFKWKKFSFKKVVNNHEETYGEAIEFIMNELIRLNGEKISFLNSCSETQKSLFFNVLASSSGIVESNTIETEDKPKLLAKYIKNLFNSSVNDDAIINATAHTTTTKL